MQQDAIHYSGTYTILLADDAKTDNAAFALKKPVPGKTLTVEKGHVVITNDGVECFAESGRFFWLLRYVREVQDDGGKTVWKNPSEK